MARIPGWVEPDQVKARIEKRRMLGKKADRAVKPPRAGHYMIFDELRGGETIVLELPLALKKESYVIAGERYDLTFKGNTLIAIAPRPTDEKGYILYQREAYRSGAASLHKVRRFVADRLIPLGAF